MALNEASKRIDPVDVVVEAIEGAWEGDSTQVRAMRVVTGLRMAGLLSDPGSKWEAGRSAGVVSGYWDGYAEAIADILRRYPKCSWPATLKMLGAKAQKAIDGYDWR